MTRPLLRPALAIWLLVLLMVSAAAALSAQELMAHPADSLPGATWWGLLPLFAAAEVLVIHLPTGRNAHGHTLREVPAVAGLAFLPPQQYLSAYVVGAGLALVLWSKQRGSKLAFNVALFSLEAALGLFVYTALLGDADPGDPRGWAAALVAIICTDLTSAVAVTCAISVTEGTFDGVVLREALRSGIAAAVVNICMALLVVVLVEARPEALPLLGFALLLLVAGYRAFISVGTGYARLQLLYRFVGAAEVPAELGPAVRALVAEVGLVMRSDRVELIIFPQEGTPGVRLLNEQGTFTRSEYSSVDERDGWWLSAASGESVLHPQPGGRIGHSTAEPVPGAPRSGLAAPLRLGGRIEAVLTVSEPTFELQAYARDDLRLFEALAAHAAVAVEKIRLVDRLRGLVEQREHEALHDALTGLPNRRAFTSALARALAGGGEGAVLVFDVNDFRDVNETLGHNAGDALLREIATRLDSCGSGSVARLGGDEFGVLLLDRDEQGVRSRAVELIALVSAPVPLRDLTLATSVSVGVAVLGVHGTDAEELLAHADIAIRTAKVAGSELEVYRPEDSGATHRRLVLAAELPTAIEKHLFEVWYQPQADAHNGRVTGAEALLRWNHPVFGFIPPPEIIAIAERIGVVRDITDAVLSDALHQRAAWAAAGHALEISVNVTPRDLRDDQLPVIVSALLELTQTPAASLTLEITESGVMSDPERCLAVLDRLAALGVRLSVDDFGTGYSSLAYLERLPVHEVKIDRSFVARLEIAAADSTVVRSTVALAHDLGLHVVAEGVETEEGWERVDALGCELVQGYHLARPMPAVESLGWLTAYAAAEQPSGTSAA